VGELIFRVVNWERGVESAGGSNVGQFLLYNFHAFTMKFPLASINFNQVPSSFPAITFIFLVVKRLVETRNCFVKQFFLKRKSTSSQSGRSEARASQEDRS